MNIKLMIAVMAAKLAASLSRMFGGKGSSLPGVVARRIYQGTLRDLAKQARKDIIMVTGTNGKTTTNNMIASVIASTGCKIVINQEGANLITGVTTAFIRYANWLGRIDCDYALLEVDEASFPKVLREISPQMVVVNNFFRDQLDRYGELDKTVTLVRDALKDLPQVHLILNSDDPLVAQMQQATGHSATFFGLAPNQRPATGSQQTREARFCPMCGEELQYESYQYSQLGSFVCPGCSFRRPEPEIEGFAIETVGSVLNASVKYHQTTATLSIHTHGFYNVYNALAAFTVGSLIGIKPEQIAKGLLTYRPAIGRMETFFYQGKPAILNLVKNPTGYNEGVNSLLSISGTKTVFMAINDNDADGKDISWLWDVDFEHMVKAKHEIELFVCSGLRAEEMALRLKYAGIPLEQITVIKEMEPAIKKALQGPGELTYLFSTYTALWSAQKILLALAEKEVPHAEGVSSIS